MVCFQIAGIFVEDLEESFSRGIDQGAYLKKCKPAFFNKTDCLRISGLFFCEADFL
jgi:hypothetical protein